jgi:phosphopantothenoylcysteine synthetase/decarboxylase
VTTPAGADWLQPDRIHAVTGRPPRSAYRQPSEVKAGPFPDAVVVCPATFNTVNKTAVAAADTYALGVIAAALGAGTPVFMVPMVNTGLWDHPRWRCSLATLDEWGVVLLDPRTGQHSPRSVESGTGEQIAAAFQPQWIVAALAALHRS